MPSSNFSNSQLSADKYLYLNTHTHTHTYYEYYLYYSYHCLRPSILLRSILILGRVTKINHPEKQQQEQYQQSTTNGPTFQVYIRKKHIYIYNQIVKKLTVSYSNSTYSIHLDLLGPQPGSKLRVSTPSSVQVAPCAVRPGRCFEDHRVGDQIIDLQGGAPQLANLVYNSYIQG